MYPNVDYQIIFSKVQIQYKQKYKASTHQEHTKHNKRVQPHKNITAQKHKHTQKHKHPSAQKHSAQTHGKHMSYFSRHPNNASRQTMYLLFRHLITNTHKRKDTDTNKKYKYKHAVLQVQIHAQKH